MKFMNCKRMLMKRHLKKRHGKTRYYYRKLVGEGNLEDNNLAKGNKSAEGSN